MPPAKKQETLIIGFGYKKGSGKTRAADRLVSEHGFVRRSFADPVRQLALAINPIIVPGMSLANILSRNRLVDVVDSYGWDGAKNTYPEVRRTLQNLGAGVRKISPDLWVDLAMSNAMSAPAVVFDDVRYPNEAAAIKKAGGIVVLVNRPGVENTDKHESELALDGYEDWDLTIDNNGTVEALLAEVDAVAHHLSSAQ